MLSIFDTQRAAVQDLRSLHMLGQRESELTTQAHSYVQLYFLLNISHYDSEKR